MKCPICNGVDQHEEWCSAYSAGVERCAPTVGAKDNAGPYETKRSPDTGNNNGGTMEVVIKHDGRRCSRECPMFNVAADGMSAICYLFGFIATHQGRFYRHPECEARAVDRP